MPCADFFGENRSDFKHCFSSVLPVLVVVVDHTFCHASVERQNLFGDKSALFRCRGKGGFTRSTGCNDRTNDSASETGDDNHFILHDNALLKREGRLKKHMFPRHCERIPGQGRKRSPSVLFVVKRCFIATGRVPGYRDCLCPGA